jgi:hypothetical protein
MSASPRIRRLTAGILALSLIWAVGPAAADAKGPAPEPDFTLSVFTEGWDWADVIAGPVGSFNLTGVINDAGDVYYLGSYDDATGDLWHQCLFVGVFGSFETALPARPENRCEYPFELSGGTDAYVGLNAAGITKARTRESFFWYDDDLTAKKWKWTYLDVSWMMEGFLDP